MKNWTKKQKVILGTAAAILIIGATAGAMIYKSLGNQKEIETALTFINEEKVNIDSIQTQLDEFRSLENPNFLSKTVEVTTLDEIKEKIDLTQQSFEGKKLLKLKKENKLLANQLDMAIQTEEVIRYQANLEKQVNDLFIYEDHVVGKNFKAIDGPNIYTKAGVKNSVNIEKISDIKKSFEEKGKVIDLPESKDKSKSWEQSIDDLLNIATKEIKTTIEITHEIDRLLKEGKNITFTQDEAKKLKEKMATINNSEVYKELDEKFNPIQKVIDDRTVDQALSKMKK